MKRLRLSPLVFRRIHKWVGLILGLQFVLWTVSGSMMALLDHHAVSGEHLGHPPEPAAWPARLLTLEEVRGRLDGATVHGLTVRPLLDRYVYEIRTSEGVRLVDAADGTRLDVNAGLARRIAAADYAGDAAAIRVSPVAEPTLETRDHQEPLWRVDFDDEGDTAIYVSQATGQVVQRRDDMFRTWDVFWMLHGMDYANRTSFNHPLIIMVAFGVLWLSTTGFYLLFKSFRKSDFRWIGRIIRRRRERSPAPQTS